MGFFESKEQSEPVKKEPVETKKTEVVKPKKEPHTFFSFDYGVDIGKNYTLPKNVRVLMPRMDEMKCTMTPEEKFKILKICFMDINNERDTHKVGDFDPDKYMDQLTDFCVYDSSTVPDIIFLKNNSRLNQYQESDDKKVFPLFSGISSMPFDIAWDTKCGVEKIGDFKVPNDLINLVLVFNPNDYTKYMGFKESYNMSRQENDPYLYPLINSLFTGVPLKQGETLQFKSGYFDHDTLNDEIGRTCHTLNKNSKLIPIYDELWNVHENKPSITKVRYNDIPNDKSLQVLEQFKTIEEIANFYMVYGSGMYLSDIISFLCKKYPKNTKITLILSTCHTLHINLKNADINDQVYKDAFQKWKPHLKRPERQGILVGNYRKGEKQLKTAMPTAVPVVEQFKGGNNDYYRKYLKYKTKYEDALMHKY